MLVPKKRAFEKASASVHPRGPASCHSTLPDKRGQSTKPCTAKVSRQPALKLRSAIMYMNKITAKITDSLLPYRNRKRCVRFNKAVQQCAITYKSPPTGLSYDKQTSVDRPYLDKIPRIPGDFPTTTCDTDKALDSPENIMPLPSSTLKSSGETTKIPSRAATDFLEKL